MSDDIVKRLRGIWRDPASIPRIELDAADEIERLRAERDAALTDARLMRENWAEADEAIAMAANRLDIAVSGDADTQHCIEVALSYLRPSEG